MTALRWRKDAPKDLVRTASVLLSPEEANLVERGRRVIYRPLSDHWRGQFGKFLEPQQPTLTGSKVPDVVHLVKEIEGKTVEDRSGRVHPMRQKMGTWIVQDVTDQSTNPDGLPSWVVVLGPRVLDF